MFEMFPILVIRYYLWIGQRLIKKIFYTDAFDLYFCVSPKLLFHLITFLKFHSLSKCDTLIDIGVQDYPGEKYRFTFNYCFLSYAYNMRLNVLTQTREFIPLHSISGLFPAAVWLEREIWDMFGSYFFHHHDIRRLLTDYGFLGHPLRKGYPLSGFREIFYDDAQKLIVHEPVELSQEFRKFRFRARVRYVDIVPEEDENTN